MLRASGKFRFPPKRPNFVRFSTEPSVQRTLKQKESYPVYTLKSSLADFHQQYCHLKNSEDSRLQTVSVCGRIQSRRVHNTVAFFSIKQGDHHLQIKLTQKDCPHEFESYKTSFRRGDIVEVSGYPTRTPAGELSILSLSMTLLTPCMHDLPNWNDLQNPNIRFRQRYLDMLITKDTNQTFIARAQIIRYLRQFLDSRGFLEVETPILSPSAGGAIAKPFVTTAIALGSQLSLRIAPELFLKQLVVGGLERVYEIGKCFRNEGIDNTHNPEFTTCEFYSAYTDYYQLMDLTEILLRGMVEHITGSPQLTIEDPKNKGQSIVLDFSRPFRRIQVVRELEKKLSIEAGQLLPPNESLEDTTTRLKQLCLKFGLDTRDSDNSTQPASPGQLFDSLVGHFVEPECVQPTFLMDHPILISPLAREHREEAGLVERFELFILNMEFCNAYTELNDPKVQRERFDAQEKEGLLNGNSKSFFTKQSEQEYVTALEYGLPPTAGWGMGIDRLTMLLTGKTSIKDVIMFPILKPGASPQDE